MENTHTVLVVGAGVAGLHATATLAAAGLDVLCLEARDRVGGRLLSVGVHTDAQPSRDGGGYLDLGATWFWAGERRIQSLIARFGIGVFAQHTAGDGVFEDRDGVRRLDGNPIDVPAFRYATGAQSIATALAATLPSGTVRLSSPVSGISADPNGLRVTTAQSDLCAAHVVLAIPPALATRIRFDPCLPPQLARLAVATPVWMGAVTKVVIQYPEPFWHRRGLAGSAVSSVGPLREIHDMSGPKTAALFGFAPSDPAHPKRAATRRPMEERVLDQLVRMFGPQLASPLRISILDWSRQPYTSPPGVAELSDYQLFGHPLYARPALQGRLHWASTETSSASAGHVEGALAAGERAAAHVLTTLASAAVTSTLE
ncbi:MAG: flavin monoamine oxidase family protein [Acidimicrobiia bacterium]